MIRSQLAVLIGSLSMAPFLFPGIVQATTITVDFKATATTGTSTGTLAGDSFNGSFSYSNKGLTGAGLESTAPTAFTFNFFKNYSLANTKFISIKFNNGTLSTLAFLDDDGKSLSSGTPDFYISLNQGIPGFLYGFNLAGENFPGPNGICPDTLDSCYSWGGSGNVTFSPGFAAPEPAGPVPVLAYVSILCGFLWLRRRRAGHLPR